MNPSIKTKIEVLMLSTLTITGPNSFGETPSHQNEAPKVIAKDGRARPTTLKDLQGNEIRKWPVLNTVTSANITAANGPATVAPLNGPIRAITLQDLEGTNIQGWPVLVSTNKTRLPYEPATIAPIKGPVRPLTFQDLQGTDIRDWPVIRRSENVKN